MEITTVRTEVHDYEEEEEDEPFVIDELCDRRNRERYYDRDATKRILTTISEIDMTSTCTLTELQHQGDKIVKAQEDVAEINDKLSSSERLVKGIASVWSAIGNKFRKKKKNKHKKRYQKWEENFKKSKMIGEEQKTPNDTETSGQGNTNLALEKQNDDTVNRTLAGLPAGEPHIYNTPEFGIEDLDEYLQEQDRDLEVALQGLRQIKEQAYVMNTTLQDQNERLDNLSEVSDVTLFRTSKARKKVTQLNS